MKNAAVGFIFITLLLDVIGLGIIIPVLPALIQELQGGTVGEAAQTGGYLLFAYAVFQFLCAPIVGGLSDRYGRRPVLLLSLLGFGIDYILLALAPSIAWLLVGRILAGIFGASFTTCNAYIADVSTPEKRAQNFGLVGVAFGLGFILGPLIGGLLGGYGGLRMPFYAAAGMSLINFLYGFFILPESLKPENRRAFSWSRANPIGTFKKLFQNRKLSSLLFAMLFVYIASHAVQSTWTYFTMEKFQWSEEMVGYSLAFVGLLSAIVQGGLIRYTIPKLGAEKSVIIGFMLYIFGLILFSMASEGWMMYAFLVPYILGGIAGPAIQGIMSNLVDNSEQGELQGGLSATMSVSLLIGPILMTSVFSEFTTNPDLPHFPGAIFIVGALFAGFSLLLTARALKKMR